MNTNEQKYFTEFADDAFIEIDENLQKIKSELLRLENFIGQKEINKKILNNMLIPFHTIKGISGMVGLVEIQNLSHSVEHYIKFLIEQKAILTEQAIAGLYDSAKLLESFLYVYKEKKFDLLESYKQELDRIIDLMFKLSSEVSESTSETTTEDKEIEKLPADVAELINENLEKDKFIYSLIFKPSPELFSKGININKVRETLNDFCEIIHSKPLKDEKGFVHFELILATKQELEENDFIKEANISLKKIYSPAKKDDKGTPPEQKEKQITEYQKFSLSNVVRIELSKVDELINKLGELVIARAKFELSLKNYANRLEKEVYRNFSEINSILERKISDLRESILRTRMVPIGELFERLKFVVHDLVRQSAKSIELELSGKETEIDKYVIEKMFDPMLHLIRNSVSHGIETQEERKNLGKNPTGKISIVAKTSGDSVVIEITDDGRGIDKSKIAQKAKELNLFKQSNEISDIDVLNILCSPGFSTRSEADMTSGRGVGMTSVKNVVEELGGRIELKTELNKGTTFIIYLPLTLSIVDAIIVEIENQLYAIPQPTISEIVVIEKSSIRVTEGFYFTDYRNQILPLIYLKEFFGLKINGRIEDRQSVIIVDTTFGRIGLVVDRIKTKREIVVRTFNDPLLRVNGISGATELGDGKPILIIDCLGIVTSFINKTKEINEGIQ